MFECDDDAWMDAENQPIDNKHRIHKPALISIIKQRRFCVCVVCPAITISVIALLRDGLWSGHYPVLPCCFIIFVAIMVWGFLMSPLFVSRLSTTWLMPDNSFMVHIGRDILSEAILDDCRSFNTMAKLMDPERTWCRNNCKGRWNVNHTHVYFARKDDAARFTMVRGTLHE